MVKGRKVLQIICEVPLEQQGEVFAALGAPLPDAETWVAIARLRVGADGKPPAVIDPPKPPAKLAQIAGIVCNEVAFQRFVGAANAEEAAEYIRQHCEVASRADIDGNERATRVFRDMKADYDNWCRGEAA